MEMGFAVAFVFLALVQTGLASFESIDTYEPATLVTDHAAIDLDQKALEGQLGFKNEQAFLNARGVYEEGGHSKSIAEITLSKSLPVAVPEGTLITGNNEAGIAVFGSAYKSYGAGETKIAVQYVTVDSFENHVGCTVGELVSFGGENTDKCLKDEGEIEIDGISDTFGYTYNQLQDNNNERTLAGFSIGAREKMNECLNCPYKDYKEFREYYGEFDYAHQWVLAAFDKGKTTFVNGNADFGNASFETREQAIKKGTAYMNVWMYVIREMEDAFDDCQKGAPTRNDDSVHAWDEAVAFYTGSIDAIGNSNNGGKLLYTLANKRCEDFKTCGADGDATEGNSKINIEIFKLFNTGKSYLLEGRCDDTRPIIEKISTLMGVPMIQGTLRYAYIVDKLQGDDKAKAEGATFAAAILPRIHACDSLAANTIYSNMRIGATSPSQVDVREAFEKTYTCMGITCDDVGELQDSVTGAAYPEAVCGHGSGVDRTEGEKSSAPKHTAAATLALLTSGVAMFAF